MGIGLTESECPSDLRIIKSKKFDHLGVKVEELIFQKGGRKILVWVRERFDLLFCVVDGVTMPNFAVHKNFWYDENIEKVRNKVRIKFEEVWFLQESIPEGIEEK